jgi:hypothetical protein
LGVGHRKKSKKPKLSALKELNSRSGEIKSMRAAKAHCCKGVATYKASLGYIWA